VVRQGNHRAAWVSKDDKFSCALGRTDAHCAKVDPAGGHRIYATEFSHRDMAEPMRSCSSRDRGFVQGNDAIPAPSKNVLIEGGSGVNVSRAK
jgi:fibrillarin-like rRNA methylase